MGQYLLTLLQREIICIAVEENILTTISFLKLRL